VVKNIIEAHAGHITIDDEPGGGTRVTLAIPRAIPVP
jgi:signal transduction histidine kinase